MEEELTPGIAEFIERWRSLPRVGLVPHVRDYLARVAAHLQPNTLLLDVVSATRLDVRLMGTKLLDTTGQELTKTNVLDIYPENLRADVGRACLTMVTFPCGQLSRRAVRTSGGMMLAGRSIALPVMVDRDVPGCIAAYTELYDAISTDETMVMVQRISDLKWVDIGAGVPT